MPSQQPPFDGKPCPVCPVEIRNLFAVASNLAQAIIRRDFCRAESRARELAAAVGDVQHLVDAHFADLSHSHGMLDVPAADHPAAEDQA